MLTVEEIRQFIDEDSTSERKLKAKVGKRYYEGDHDILNYRLFFYDADGNLQEDKFRTNVRISHPFFTELVDQLVQHMLSFDENPIKAKNSAEGLQEQLDKYFDEEFWSETAELLTETESQGFGYMYAYKNIEDRISFQCADSMGVVEVRAKDTDDGCEYIIYWYIDRIEKSHKKIKRIQVWDKNQIYYYVQDSEGAIVKDDTEKINPRPHIVYEDKGKLYGGSLGFIPFWRLDTCRKQTSGLKPIKSLIDDYDLMECGLTNNIQDFDTPLHVVSGYQGDNLDELQQNLKTKKIVGVDSDGSIDIKTIDIPYNARKTKADEDEKNIYRFGMGLNSAGLKDTTATTNMAIKMAYTLLDLKADKLEKRLKAFLRELVEVVLEEINATFKTDYRTTDIKFDFDRHVIVNEVEQAQIKSTKAQAQSTKINTLMNLMEVAPEEQIKKDICEIMDWDYEQLKDEFPGSDDPMDDTMNAMDLLNGAETEDVNEGIDEGEAETQNNVIQMLEDLLNGSDAETEDDSDMEDEETEDDSDEEDSDEGIDDGEAETQNQIIQMLEDLLNETEDEEGIDDGEAETQNQIIQMLEDLLNETEDEEGIDDGEAEMQNKIIKMLEDLLKEV